MPVEEMTEDEWERRWFNRAVQAARNDQDNLDDHVDQDLLLI